MVVGRGLLALAIAMMVLATVDAAGSGSSSSSGSGSGGGDSGHHKWWKYDYEYEFLQDVVVLCLVLVTIIFEHVHHHIDHFMEHTADYVEAKKGGPKHEAHHEVRSYEDLMNTQDRTSLWNLLCRKLTGELTVLGFLAFVVWCVNQAELFDHIHESYKSVGDIHLPGDGTTYLHMVEAVHMQLFVGMIFYFILVGCSIHFALRHMTHWHDVSYRINQGIRDGTLKAEDLVKWSEKQDQQTHWFVLLRKSFLSGLQSWRHSGDWNFFEETLGTVADHYRKDRTLETYLDDFFPLGQYLGLNYKSIISDMVEIKTPTWIGIIVIMLVASVIHRSGVNMRLAYIVPIASSVIVLIVYAWVKLRQGTLQSIHYKHSPRMAHPIYHRLTPALTVCRMFQICIFCMSFEFATVIASKHEWATNEVEAIGFTLALILGILPYGYLMGRLLAGLAITTACGSFITEKNVLRIAVILERHGENKDKQRIAIGDEVDIIDEAGEALTLKIEHGDFKNPPETIGKTEASL